MGLFIRLTILVALAIVVLTVLAKALIFGIHALFFGAIVAAIILAVVGGVGVVRRLLPSRGGPLVRR